MPSLLCTSPAGNNFLTRWSSVIFKRPPNHIFFGLSCNNVKSLNMTRKCQQALVVTKISLGFSLRILVAGERCKVTGEYFERDSTSVNKK